MKVLGEYCSKYFFKVWWVSVALIKKSVSSLFTHRGTCLFKKLTLSKEYSAAVLLMDDS